MTNKRKRKKIIKIIETIFVIAVLLVGICFVSYSTVITFISDYSQTKVIDEYEESLKKQKQDSIDRLKKKAEEYNNSVTNIVSINNDKKDNKVKSKTVYEIGELEGYITIPAIDIALPIYEGTLDNSLYMGVGHIPTTSLPPFGKNSTNGTHCVLAGHSALSSATLFDDLDQLKLGDVFYIKFLNETYKYKVNKITPHIKPYDADEYIKSEKGKDYCTLLTCTPKTINTHRLLVRGIRVPVSKEEAEMNNIAHKLVKEKEQRMNIIIFIVLASILAFILIFVLLKVIRKQIRKRKLKSLESSSRKNISPGAKK